MPRTPAWQAVAWTELSANQPTYGHANTCWQQGDVTRWAKRGG